MAKPLKRLWQQKHGAHLRTQDQAGKENMDAPTLESLHRRGAEKPKMEKKSKGGKPVGR